MTHTVKTIKLTVIMLLAFCLAPVVSVFPSASAHDELSRYSGVSVFGVDVYGRWLIGLDSDGDGSLDRYWRFTGEEYSTGPWFETRRASVTQLNSNHSLQRVVLESVDSEYRLEFWHNKESSAELVAPHESGDEMFGQEYKIERGTLVALSGARIEMGSFDPIDLNSWPYGFTRPDAFFDPQTQQMSGCQDYSEWPVQPACQAGGPGSSGCSISGCETGIGGGNESCSVSCFWGCYACCDCYSQFLSGSAICGCITGY